MTIHHLVFSFLQEANSIQIAGFFLAAIYLMLGLDDLIWDAVNLVAKQRTGQRRLDLGELDSIPPKLLAVVIAAWHEDNVIEDVIDHFIESTHYPRSMYHIFLGVYPNDNATIEAVNRLSGKYDNVHVIINCLPGPTSKAQNINHVIRQIKIFEQARGWRFMSLTIHDSEDVVHPYELKVTNYLLDKHEAIQFPVFPLMQMPKFSTFFKTLTTGTYADEFAENHFFIMPGRNRMNAFVPSAGTGFALSRATIELFGDEDVLPRDSLTEDYRLSLTLFEKGVPMYYVLERVPRVTHHERETFWDFIATRSMFPRTFQTAVKQKTRWILGITMQSVRVRDIFRKNGLNLAARYTLYRDLKAKIANLISMAGYPILLYVFASFWAGLPPVFPPGTVSWYMCFVVTALMIERQVLRGLAIYHVYGSRMVFFSCLFPPLLPIRVIWGNIVNLTATLRAFRQNISANAKGPKKDRKAASGNEKKDSKSVKSKTNVETNAETNAETNVGTDAETNVEINAETNPETNAETKSKSKEKAPKKFAWAKTDHHFLEKNILKRYHRQTGDVLLRNQAVTPEQFQSALQESIHTDQAVGGILRARGLITEDQLLSTLAQLKHTQYIRKQDLHDYDLKQFAARFHPSVLILLLAAPILQTALGYVFAFCDDSPAEAQLYLEKKYAICIMPVFMSRTDIMQAIIQIDAVPFVSRPRDSEALRLLASGNINHEQAFIVRQFATEANVPETLILGKVGLLSAATNSQAEKDNISLVF